MFATVEFATVDLESRSEEIEASLCQAIESSLGESLCAYSDDVQYLYSQFTSMVAEEKAKKDSEEEMDNLLTRRAEDAYENRYL